MTCNPSAVACQLELIKRSIDNPNAFEIAQFVATVLLTFATVVVAIVATNIASKAKATAERANELSREAQSFTEHRAQDHARRERYEWAKLVQDYLRDAGVEWSGTPVTPSSRQQWIDLVQRSVGLPVASQSARWVAAKAKQVGDEMLTNPRSTDPEQLPRLTKRISVETFRVTQWVDDPENWTKLYWTAADAAGLNDPLKNPTS